MKSKKKKIFWLLSEIFIAGLLLLIEKLYVTKIFSIDRFIILYFILSFIILHIFVKPSKIWNFIYDKRYLIAIFLLVFTVVCKYNMSSIGMWSYSIPEGGNIENGFPFLGIPRSIRSDEWLVSTPTTLSQSMTDNPYSLYNNLTMGINNKVSLYPNLPMKRFNIISSLFNIGYVFLPTEYAFSFTWMSKIIAFMLFSFEFCMILTNRNKLYSLLGMFLLAFAPTYHWWTSIDMIIWGEIAICVLYKFINSEKRLHRFLWSMILGVVGLNYLMGLYPAWQLPFGYVYAVIVFYLIIKNKDKLKWKYLLYLIPVFIIMFGIFIPIYMENKDVFEIISNTVYPGARFSTGGYGWQYLFNYFSQLFYPYKTISNPCEFSQFNSLYPIPIILGLYYTIISIKKKEVNGLVLSLTILSILLSIWNFIELPSIISKITFLYMSTPERTTTVVGYIMAILIVLILSNYETTKIKTNIFNNIFIPLVTIIIVTLGICTTINTIDAGYMSTLMIIISSVLIGMSIYLLMLNNKKYNMILVLTLIIISLISAATINPINKGLSIMYGTPFAEELQKIDKEDNDALWLATDSLMFQNYMIANGVSTINSTNTFPNLEFWEIIDEDSQYNEIYNRYAHIIVNLTSDETSAVLNQPDLITLNLNKDDVCKLDIDYIVTANSTDTIYDNYDLEYFEGGIRIYKTNCK